MVIRKGIIYAVEAVETDYEEDSSFEMLANVPFVMYYGTVIKNDRLVFDRLPQWDQRRAPVLAQ